MGTDQEKLKAVLQRIAIDIQEHHREWSYMKIAAHIADTLADDGWQIAQAKPCVYEARSRYEPSVSLHASNVQTSTWCRTHGWECPARVR